MPSKLDQNKNFQPVLIVSQITFLISIYYVVSIFFTILFNSIFGLFLHTDQIFSDKNFDFSSAYGYCSLFTLFFTSLSLIVTCVVVIDKANKILDYVLTNYLLHFIFVCLNSGFPTSLLWWFFNAVSATIITVVAEYVSLRIDQKNIQIDHNVSSTKI